MIDVVQKPSNEINNPVGAVLGPWGIALKCAGMGEAVGVTLGHVLYSRWIKGDAKMEKIFQMVLFLGKGIMSFAVAYRGNPSSIPYPPRRGHRSDRTCPV